MPVCLGWVEGEQPALVLEELSHAHWPPPWNSAQIDAVLAALTAVHSSRIALELPALEEMRAEFNGWARVAADPGAFLAMGLCTPEWLGAALPALQAAETAAVLEGDDLLHLDVRSDNVCLDRSRAVLIDWNWACRGNGRVDLAGWLPSLRAEGGPLPEEILPDQPELAAMHSGYWAYRAGLPPPGPGGRVRELQLKQLGTALPWAARALGLPPLEERR
jgi:aminoglycoside phosphotransferase (APT) family kinase protein